MAVSLGDAYVTIKPSTKNFITTLAKEGNSAGKQTGTNFTNSFSSIVKGSAIFSVVNSALTSIGNAFTSTLSAGIKRYDTMKTFPTIMKNLGYSTEDAAVQVERLSQGVRGLPTSLSDITNLTTQVAPLTKSLAEATDVSLAFNNMLVASGKPMADQQRAMQQYTQALAKGKPDYMDWRTMQEVMPAQLDQVAKHMLGASANVQTLGDALKSGEISMQEFNAAIVDMNNNDLTGFGDFATQAKENSRTIQTGLDNIQNAFARFWETVLKEIDGNDAVVGALDNVQKAIDGLAVVVGATIGALATFGGAIADIVSKLNELGGIPLVLASAAAAFAGLWTAVRIGKNVISMLLPKLTNLATTISDKLPKPLQKTSTSLGKFGKNAESAGKSAGKSVGQLLGMAAVIASIGASIWLATNGFATLSTALTGLADKGSAGIAVLAIAGGVLIGLVATVSLLAPATAAAALPLLAFGASIALIGVAVALVVFSLAQLCTQLPLVAEYGLQASLNFLALGGSLVVFGAGALVAGVGAIVLGAGLLVCAAGLLACSIPLLIIAGAVFIAGFGMEMFGAGALMAGSGCAMLAPFLLIIVGAMAGLAGTGFLAAAGIGAFALAVGVAAVELGLITWIYDNFAKAIEKAGYWSDVLHASLDGVAGASGWAAECLQSIEGVVDNCIDVMHKLADEVKNTVSTIQDAFANMKLHIPSPTLGAMPHFSMSGRFNTETGEVPKINVDWYAKGGVFNRPQIIGVGDASSPEIVTPEDKMRAIFEAVMDKKAGMQVNQTINTNDPALTAAVVVSKLRRAF